MSSCANFGEYTLHTNFGVYTLHTDFGEYTLHSNFGEYTLHTDFGVYTLHSEFGEYTLRTDFGECTIPPVLPSLPAVLFLSLLPRSSGENTGTREKRSIWKYRIKSPRRSKTR